MRKVKKKIFEIKEDVRIGDVILEAGDRIEVLSEGNAFSVAKRIKSILNGDNFHYDNIEVTENDVTIQLNMLATGPKWTAIEEKFYSLFPEGEMNGIDIYLEGTRY